MTKRLTVVADWRTRKEEDLVDVPPNGDGETMYAAQDFIDLHGIIVRDLSLLVRVRIGAADDIPFELESDDGPHRIYRPIHRDAVVKKRLIATGAVIMSPDSITIVPGMEIRWWVRNTTVRPIKLRTALLVQEEA